MPLQATSGAASYDAFGGGVPVVPAYIEEVFSTYLYTGTGSALSITNNIDLSTKGGLVWIKDRSVARSHVLYDTARGIYQSLSSNLTSGNTDQSPDGVTAFNTTGFSLGGGGSVGDNTNGDLYASWTFRKQPKFFDVVTWTGDGANRTIAHNLGSVPGCIIVKRTDTTGAWQVYHRSLANTEYLVLNTTAVATTGATRWNSTTPTSTVFSLGTDATVNASGGTYVAYVYAHDAGGFGLTGTDNVISCGSFTTDGSGNATVSLGYEPQFLTFKATNNAENWGMFDIARGWSVAGNTSKLFPNLSNAQYSGSQYGFPTATGFNVVGLSSSITYIYIAIRRGPMKVPTVGTSVFSPSYGLSASNSEFVNAGFPIDLNWRGRTTGDNVILQDRLRAADNLLFSNLTDSESNAGGSFIFTTQNGCTFTSTANFSTWVNWSFRRAPSFFDEVCYTGTGSNPNTISHNLASVPELIIIKERSATQDWLVQYGSARGGFLNLTDALSPVNVYAGSTVLTSTQLSLNSTNSIVNASSQTYVAYLFATCAGVSKVGSYTGNGTTQTINCGFTGGARFVLLKRTDSTGGWYVYDTARGMTVLTDPYLLLNSTAAESATLGSVTTVSTGFALNSTILAAINVSAASYIFLAIA